MGEGEVLLIREVPREVCHNCATWNTKKHCCNREATPDAPYCSKTRSDVTEEAEWIKRQGAANTTNKKLSSK